MSILEQAGNTIHSDVLSDSGLDWKVELSHGLSAPTTSGEYYTGDKCATVRTDTGHVLGVVSPEYKIVQNNELVYMAERIAKSNNLTIDTAGELRNGGRVWLSVRADSFEVGGVDDEIKPYLLLTNGHDGLYSLSGTPTSVRTWCDNTLNMALREGRRSGQAISIRHKGNMEDKIEDLTDTLSEFYHRTAQFQQQANYLSSWDMDSKSTSSYFNDAYNQIIKDVPVEAKDKSDERAQAKKMSTVMKWWDTFDKESHFGRNGWIAFNAITNWIDHGTSFRGDKKTENRFSANFYGSNADKKQRLLEYTLSYA